MTDSPHDLAALDARLLEARTAFDDWAEVAEDRGEHDFARLVRNLRDSTNRARMRFFGAIGDRLAAA